MTITARLYGPMLTALWNAEFDYDTHAINATLHTSTYTPNQDTHDYFNDATNELGTAGGYTAGGLALASKTVTYTGGTNTHVLDAADLQWAAATLTFRTLVLHDRNAGTDATRPLIGYQQSDTDITATGGNLDVVWNAAGIVSIVVA
jgi:hypothetical protein